MTIFPKRQSAKSDVMSCVIAIWVNTNRILSAQTERDNHAYWQKLEEMVCRESIVAIIAELKARWAAIGLPAPLELSMPSPSPQILTKLRKSFPNNPAAARIFRSPCGDIGSASRKRRYRKMATGLEF
jgi:hypothetical protein